MFSDEFPPVANHRPTDARWFHQLGDHYSTVDGTVDGYAAELPVAKLFAGADDTVHALVIPRQRRPYRD